MQGPCSRLQALTQSHIKNNLLFGVVLRADWSSSSSSTVQAIISSRVTGCILRADVWTPDAAIAGTLSVLGVRPLATGVLCGFAAASHCCRCHHKHVHPRVLLPKLDWM